MHALDFIEKLEKWIDCNEFTQQPEAANYGINPDYQAVDAEDLKQWLDNQRKVITGNKE